MLAAEEYNAWAGLLYVHANLVRQLDVDLQSAHDISLITYEVLLMLWRADEHQLALADLATLVVLSLSGMSHLIDRLERDRLVVRQRSTEDRRKTYAVLTSEGLTCVQSAHRTHLKGVQLYFLDQLSTADIATLGRCWEQIIPGTQEAIRRNT